MGASRISIEQVGKVWPGNEAMHDLHKKAAQRIVEVQVDKFVVEVTVEHDDIWDAAGIPGAFTCGHSAKIRCVQKVEKITTEGQMPSSHVLVTTIHRLAWSANAAFTFKHTMNEALAISCADDYVIPESEEAGCEASGLK
jgi:hypothetical protein